jgi:hypothetical protein
VQVVAEALRSWMVVQMVPAAPSVPWTDPRSAEAAQRPGWPPDGWVVAGAAGGRGLPVDAELTGDGVADGWEAADGRVATAR